MKIQNLPFNISFLDPDARATYGGLLPVKSAAMFDGNSTDFHPQGLYSDVIFGRQGEDRRMESRSYIDMHVEIFHPLYLQELSGFRSLYGEIIMGTGYAIWNPKTKDFDKSNVVSGQTGYHFFLEHFKQISFKQGPSEARKLKISLLEKFRDVCMIRHHAVIPAGIREVAFDENNRPVEDDLNALYRSLLSRAKTVTPEMAATSGALFDNTRVALTRAAASIYEHIFNLLEGKGGFLQSKWGSRRVFGTTRNVLSSMEVGSVYLGDPNAPQQNTTIVGLPQYLSSAVPLIRYQLRENVLPEFFANINGDVALIDPKTLSPETSILSEKIRSKWGTDDGLNSLIAGFLEPQSRHSPIMINGNYISLIYRDDNGFRLMSDINDLPEGLDRAMVTPLTWAELFYMAAAPTVKDVRAFVTRYPITGLGSIYVSRVYLKTTVVGKPIKHYNKDFQLEELEYPEFPATAEKIAFLETMQVHVSQLSLLGADFDGDTISFSLVHSKEAVAESDAILDSLSTYVSPTGDLVFDSTSDVTDWVLATLTSDVEEPGLEGANGNADIRIFGEMHTYGEDVNRVRDSVIAFKPDLILHELWWEDADFYSSRLPGVEVLPLEDDPPSLKTSTAKYFASREESMLAHLDAALLSGTRIAVVVGDTHLRTIRTRDLGAVSPLTAWAKEHGALIVRSPVGEIK